jgi:DNA-binding IclR family transcriptional regulator
VLVLDRVEGTRTLRTYTPLGARSPMHSTSPGKLLLAYATADVADAIARRLTKFSAHTIASRSRLDAELARIRTQGYATARAEWHEDVAGISAPIRRADATIIAALTVSGPIVRFRPAQMKVHLPNLLAAAGEISARLGYQALPR